MENFSCSQKLEVVNEQSLQIWYYNHFKLQYLQMIKIQRLNEFWMLSQESISITLSSNFR